MRVFLSSLLSLSACVAPVAPDHEHDHPHGHDHDHDALPDLPSGSACGDVDHADLAPEWCVRLAPSDALSEPHEVPGAPTAPPSPGQVDTRCADINMLQSVALVGTTDAPRVAWCDPNLRGGPRAATRDARTGRVVSAVFADEGCVSASHGMGLVPREDGGWQATWLGFDHRDTLVRSAPLGPDGELEGAPETVFGTWGVAAAEPLPVAADDALLTLTGGELHVERVVHQAIEEARLLGEHVHAFGAARGEGALWVVVCAPGGLRLERLDPWSLDRQTVEELQVGCGMGARVHVAAGPAGVAAAWEALDGGWLWLHDGRDTIERIHLGQGATAPAVAPRGEGWLTVDGSGSVRLWSPEGEPEGALTHANLVGRAARGGDVVGIYPLVDDRALVLAVVGQETLRMDPHVYTYQTLELSRVALP